MQFFLTLLHCTHTALPFVVGSQSIGAAVISRVCRLQSLQYCAHVYGGVVKTELLIYF